MELPADTNLPFFAYGLFKPGQLGFYRIREFVEHQQESTTKGSLYERDGLPLLATGNDDVRGCLLTLRADGRKEAYTRVVEIEPDKQYRWDTVSVDNVNGPTDANVLRGRSFKRGSGLMDENSWDGRDDPLFKSALKVVGETLKANKEFEWDLKPFFRLQMAYLLLWSAIERFVSLKYHFGQQVKQKVDHLADEPAFAEALKAVVSAKRELVRADQPDTKLRLDPSSPKKSLDYYYQVRSNVTHRGKAVTKDYEIVRDSLTELLAIFKAVLAEAFGAQFEDHEKSVK